MYCNKFDGAQAGAGATGATTRVEHIALSSPHNCNKSKIKLQ